MTMPELTDAMEENANKRGDCLFDLAADTFFEEASTSFVVEVDGIIALDLDIDDQEGTYFMIPIEGKFSEWDGNDKTVHDGYGWRAEGLKPSIIKRFHKAMRDIGARPGPHVNKAGKRTGTANPVFTDDEIAGIDRRENEMIASDEPSVQESIKVWLWFGGLLAVVGYVLFELRDILF